MRRYWFLILNFTFSMFIFSQNILTVVYPSYSILGGKDTVYVLRIGTDGIIESIEANGVKTNIESSRDNEKIIYYIDIENEKKEIVVNTDQHTSQNNNVIDTVFYGNSNSTIFENSINYISTKEIIYTRLIETKNKLYYEKKQGEVYKPFGRIYLENTLYFRLGFSEVPDRKLEYKQYPSEIRIFRYENRSKCYEAYDGYISISGKNIHSTDMKKNILNHYITSIISFELEQVLFPLFFLDVPIQKVINDWEYTASSYLKEKNTSYTPNNLNEKAGLPWASANGYGIGDKIIIDMKEQIPKSLLFINGYNSENKSYLYEENSRVKRLKLTNIKTGQSKQVDVSPFKNDETLINISELFLTAEDGSKLELEIIEIYKGTKYKDVCIQAILPHTFPY